MLKKVIERAGLPKSLEVLQFASSAGKGASTTVATEGQVGLTVYDPKHLVVDFGSPKSASSGRYDDDDTVGGGHESVPLPFGFKDTAGSLSLDSDRQRLVAGVGEKPTIRDYRLAVTTAVREAQKLKASSLLLRSLPDTVSTMGDLFQPASALSSGELTEKTVVYAVTAAYRYDRLLSKEKGAVKRPARGGKAKAAAVADVSDDSIKLYIKTNDTTSISNGNIIGSCINDARNLGNLRQDEGTPQFYCEWIRRELEPLGVKVQHVLRGEQLYNAGLNLIYNVGKGSKHQPYLVVFEYLGNKRSNKATALVGKGVTFDCGGLNVKPYGSMETMYMDMMGAATVIATVKAIAGLKLPVNVVAAVGLAENAIGPNSYCPSCILSSRKGLNVEVLNTDAEGRLVLADTLTYLQKDAKVSKKASTIIDVATLTGAIVVGLGSRRAGLFSNDLLLTQQLMASGRSSGDEVWPMPIGEEHQQAVKGNIADLMNVSTSKEAGSCTAAAFLSNFVEEGVRWAHIDIAGAGMGTDKPKGFQPAGAPGFGVELMLDFFRQHVLSPSKDTASTHHSGGASAEAAPVAEIPEFGSGEEEKMPGAKGKAVV
uniref:Putative cytosolic leucyl aminopeptidase n=1 Tax=Trypanosoma congolense (strain IL3000) TaxID=1068625 RepID=G0URS4_TRYCI|nr:putative cytosolic leucyl aminopeptidase [Trypanosoma congolense IL3000]